MESCCDPNPPPFRKGLGLTEFGKKVIGEMNRLGMMVDISHVAHSTMNAVLDTTRAPVLFSHSSSHSFCQIERNVPDTVSARPVITLSLSRPHTLTVFLGPGTSS